MSSRPLIIAGLLGASVGVPYLATHSSKAGTETQNPWHTAGNAAPSATTAIGQPMSSPAMPLAPNNGVPITNQVVTPLNGTQFQSVDQVLRFDVTKDWVYRNWTRKSTGPTDVGLFAVRVPLVMGTQLSGLAGSLTYYFNPQGAVEHISFRGRTGDTTQLVQFLTRYYRLQRVEGSVGEQVYQVGDGERIQSELRTRPEAVLVSSSPNSSIAVELELARPGSQRYLPPRPTGLQIPPAAPAAQSPTAQATSGTGVTSKIGEWGSSAKSAVGSYFNQGRYATPQEESQVLWKRWPD